jgi:hypothetical protein
LYVNGKGVVVIQIDFQSAGQEDIKRSVFLSRRQDRVPVGGAYDGTTGQYFFEYWLVDADKQMWYKPWQAFFINEAHTVLRSYIGGLG